MKSEKYCVILVILRTFRAVDPNANPVISSTGNINNCATFEKNNAKLYVPVITLFINDNINFLENIKQGFETTIYWKKYRSERTAQPKNQQFRLSN